MTVILGALQIIPLYKQVGLLVSRALGLPFEVTDTCKYMAHGSYISELMILRGKNYCFMNFHLLNTVRNTRYCCCFVCVFRISHMLTIIAGKKNCPILSVLDSSQHLLRIKLGSLTCMRMTLPEHGASIYSIIQTAYQPD